MDASERVAADARKWVEELDAVKPDRSIDEARYIEWRALRVKVDRQFVRGDDARAAIDAFKANVAQPPSAVS